MKRMSVCATAIALFAVMASTNAHATNSKSESEAKANAKANSKVTASQLNKQQLKSMNNTSVVVEDDDNDVHWWMYGGANLGATSNVVPGKDNFEGTREFRVSGPLGAGFSIPFTMIDNAAIFNRFANRIVQTWDAKAVVTDALMVERALQCEMLDGVEEALERVGKVCPH